MLRGVLRHTMSTAARSIAKVSVAAATSFLVVWAALGAFVVYEYLRPLRQHRRGAIIARLLPVYSRRRAFFLEVLRAVSVTGSICALALATLRPSQGHMQQDGNVGGFAGFVRFCQIALLWWREPLINDIVFGAVVIFGCFLFLHRMVLFCWYGVQLRPFQHGHSFTGQVPWMARITGGGWYHQSCDDIVSRAIFRTRGLQLTIDVFLMSSVRFLVSTGACSEWGAALNGGQAHVPFDPFVACGSRTQVALLVLALVAFLGWYVWVVLLIMRMQNHYSESALGHSHYPPDLYNPFFLTVLIQARILLGILSALVPFPICIIPACAAVCSLLLGLMFWQAPCRFRLVNWVYASGLLVGLGVSLLAFGVAEFGQGTVHYEGHASTYRRHAAFSGYVVG